MKQLGAHDWAVPRDQGWRWRLESQGSVRPRLVVVEEGLAYDSPQMALTEDDQAVQALAPATTDKSGRAFTTPT